VKNATFCTFWKQVLKEKKRKGLELFRPKEKKTSDRPVWSVSCGEVKGRATYTVSSKPISCFGDEEATREGQ